MTFLVTFLLILDFILKYLTFKIPFQPEIKCVGLWGTRQGGKGREGGHGLLDSQMMFHVLSSSIFR
jgi:hypothetical protein